MLSLSSVAWPQLFPTEDVEQAFTIIGYPTNILVLLNGRECVVTHQANDAFFKRYVH